MAGMARSRGRPHGRRTRGPRAVAVTVAVSTLVAPFLSACTGDEPEDAPPASEQVTLHVDAGRGAGSLSDEARTTVETQVGDVLSHYVVSGFLGEYPRDDLVRAFDDFTAGAAREAAKDVDLLTGARFQDASAIRATRLDARLSVLVLGREVVGATAAVRFGFEAEVDGESQPFSLRGRFLLKDDAGTWTVFGYDVQRDDGGTAEAEVSP
jgi:hypothetical protein